MPHRSNSLHTAPTQCVGKSVSVPSPSRWTAPHSVGNVYDTLERRAGRGQSECESSKHHKWNSIRGTGTEGQRHAHTRILYMDSETWTVCEDKYEKHTLSVITNRAGANSGYKLRLSYANIISILMQRIVYCLCDPNIFNTSSPQAKNKDVIVFQIHNMF